MSKQGLTPEFALGYCAMMLDGILREAEITKKVIAAVPDAASSYRPDPNASHREGTSLAYRQQRYSVSRWNCRPEVQHGDSGTQAANLSRSGRRGTTKI